MAAIVWKDRVKFYVVELSRASYFKLARDVRALDEALASAGSDDTDALAYMIQLNDLIACASIARIEVFEGDQWRPIGEARAVEVNGTEYTLAQPMTTDLFQALPASIAAKIIEASEKENELLTALFFTGEPSATNTTSQSELPSGDEP